MDEKIDKAIENLLAMIRANIKADDAQKFSQAAQKVWLRLWYWDCPRGPFESRTR